MPRFPLVLLATLYLSACAAAAPLPPAPSVPGDVGTPQDPASTDPVTPPPPAGEPIAVVPDRWWLLDPETDGVYGAAVDRAYRELLRDLSPTRTVIVAIIDSGVDVEHEDLRASVWRNPRETRNQRDDDGDGLIDDIFGWNYIGGADGSHIDDDTYEVTRLYAACARLFGSMPPPPPPAAQVPAESVTREQCPAIEEGFREKVLETRQMLGQIGQMHETVAIVVDILQAHLGTQELTVEAVRNVTPLRNDLRQARDIYLQLAAANITPKMIADELDRLERLMAFGLNPEFDPRPIVGDNYADPTQRVYGNSDVVGPDARHGTGVAGIVAAGRGNDLGTDGIAGSTQIMALRAVPNGDERDKDVANAIRYAVDHGAHIINMSFGKAWSPFKGAVDEAVRYAETRGVLLIHAAGNDAKDLASERNYPNRYLLAGDTARLWLEVGASSWRGAQNLAAEFSNYGRHQVDIFAPGSDILSTAPGNEYEAASGTSFAAPVVSGVAALIMAYFPELSAADVRRIILESATPLGDRMVVRPGTEDELVRFGDLSVTGAIVNAYNAIRMAEQLTAARRN
jgi:subtilisin family serine protease